MVLILDVCGGVEIDGLLVVFEGCFVLVGLSGVLSCG